MIIILLGKDIYTISSYRLPVTDTLSGEDKFMDEIIGRMWKFRHSLREKIGRKEFDGRNYIDFTELISIIVFRL
jgi:hypothetical protein